MTSKVPENTRIAAVAPPNPDRLQWILWFCDPNLASMTVDSVRPFLAMQPSSGLASPCICSPTVIFLGFIGSRVLTASRVVYMALSIPGWPATSHQPPKESANLTALPHLEPLPDLIHCLTKCACVAPVSQRLQDCRRACPSKQACRWPGPPRTNI